MVVHSVVRKFYTTYKRNKKVIFITLLHNLTPAQYNGYTNRQTIAETLLTLNRLFDCTHRVVSLRKEEKVRRGQIWRVRGVVEDYNLLRAMNIKSLQAKSGCIFCSQVFKSSVIVL